MSLYPQNTKQSSNLQHMQLHPLEIILPNLYKKKHQQIVSTGFASLVYDPNFMFTHQ
jgi:hypothetical protein